MSQSFEEEANNPLYQRFPGLRNPEFYDPFEAPEGEDPTSPRLREERIFAAAARLCAFLDRTDVAACTLDEARVEAELALTHLRMSWGRSWSRCPALNSGLLR